MPKLEVTLNLKTLPEDKSMEMTIEKSVERESLYGIGDVSKICSVPTHTIRFWEKEFGSFLSPTRTIGKQRRYTDSDIRQIMKIKQLLWTDRFSIQGARRMLGTARILTFSPSQDTVRIPDTNELALSIAHFIQDQLTKTQTA
jgi:DNA-binding transcriptional MerR regulator